MGALLWDCMATEMDFLGYLQGFFLQSGIVLILLKKGSGNCDLELSAWHSSAESWGGWVLLCGEEGTSSCLGFLGLSCWGLSG